MTSFSSTTARLALVVALAALAIHPSATATASAAVTQTFTVAQDTYTSQGNPSATHGTLGYLSTDSAPGAERRSYVMVTVGSVPSDASIVSATLRFRANSSSTAAFTVSTVGTSWSSGTLTWNNQPAIGATVATRTGVSTGSVSFDVSGAVKGNGTYAFVLRSTSTAQVTFASREAGTSPPALDVTWSASTSDPVVAAAGDIGCVPGATPTPTTCQQAATAKLLLGSSTTAVQTVGDNENTQGTSADFAGSYAPTWGAVLAKTHPAPGNHEYRTAGAAGYFGYFGAAAGSPSRGYYSYDLGSWHVVVLNSEIAIAAGSAQDVWFRNDLASHQARCTLAVWHEPVFSSSGNDPSRNRLFADAYAGGVDVVLNGHQHNYERFAPQDATGRYDASAGVTEFVVGTGGYSLWRATSAAANSQARGTVFGVLRLTLHATSYDWRFVPISGSTYTDAGTGTCH